MAKKTKDNGKEMSGFVKGRLGRIQHTCSELNPYEKSDYPQRGDFHRECISKLKVCTMKRNEFENCLRSETKELGESQD